MFRMLLVALVVILLLGRALPARADSWLPPGPMDFFSDNGAYRFHVVPAVGEATDQFGQEATTAVAVPKPPFPCVGTLARKGGDGAFTEIWSGPLANPVMPADVRVATDGAFVVTFDDWGALGTSPNTVVAYDAKGKTLCRLALADLLTKDEIAKIPKTVSSLMWADAAHEIDPVAKRLTLGSVGRRVVIDLVTGKVLPKEPEKK